MRRTGQHAYYLAQSLPDVIERLRGSIEHLPDLTPWPNWNVRQALALSVEAFGEAPREFTVVEALATPCQALAKGIDLIVMAPGNHEAPTHAVTRISRSSATGSIDNSPGGFLLH